MAPPADLDRRLAHRATDRGDVAGVLAQQLDHALAQHAVLGPQTGQARRDVVADRLGQVLGPDLLQQLSAKSGLSVEDLLQKLSQVLPQAVDHLTPGGTIPKA